MVKVKAHTRRTKDGKTIRVRPYERSKSNKKLVWADKYVRKSEVYDSKLGKALIEVDLRWNPIKKAYEFFYALSDADDPFTAPDFESDRGFERESDAIRAAKKHIQKLEKERGLVG